jgi:hypothetical protein
VDLEALRVGVDAFFARLARVGEAVGTPGEWAPWIPGLTAAAAALELARRWARQFRRGPASADEAVLGPSAILRGKGP